MASSTDVPASNMNQKLHISTSEKSDAYAFAQALQELLDPPPVALSVFEAPNSGWSLEAYFQENPDEATIRTILVQVTGRPVPRMQYEDIPDLNWVAHSQASLPPVYAGSFIVHGSHDIGRIPHGPRALLIDAGEAFGTAHHATTYCCLLAIDRLTRHRSYKKILDLGCGSGILALAASRRLPKAMIIASDNDRTSLRVAKENSQRNGLAARIEFLCADGAQHTRLRREKPFDLICANILAEPLIKFAPYICALQRSGGTLLLSGILIPQSNSVRARYGAMGYRLTEHIRYTGWSTLLLQRR